ncbi:ethanolamine ammonia-lyase reactivating factor EutA [Micromonospora sp. 4G57]|uniref:Ethanolamine ammonia-lyase reactivating factor EutA n=1 Tax=Micromonospora sicca TaxID=2202420 RepID=A0ABU5JE10_9ACTN|nr:MULTISPECIES: ethanolamine ammonia-lyase reactivating factor EutA [unclassified Micromonospora]MDZ5445063.1 ethanolamine ammonia-lyase reactivating factor EutA [Micromonospora sp. 4G57]MDZ5490817.1 ethanolamine ammonia-lyase reactivating factor EutA [Micromonospora sp. 4G53]
MSEHHHQGHHHDHGHHHHDDHGHSHAWETEPVPEDAEEMDGIERLTLHSAGLDVGSATSHLTISRLVLKRLGVELSNQFVVAERTELYRSQVTLTPYRDDSLIDAAALQGFFDAAYREAGFTPVEIDTGVMIVTGEAANRPNAEELATTFAARSGAFICVAAGPHYEALLAAHGSGAVALSATGQRVLNVDIGGGTTKLSVVSAGEVLHTGAFSVGARLVAFDGSCRLTRVEPPGRWMLDLLGSSADVGDVIDEPVLDALTGLMADLVLQVIDRQPRDELLHRLWVTGELPAETFDDIGTIVFSGGVSEHIYGRETGDFGDLGLRLGTELRKRLAASGLGAQVIEPAQGIRATVLGAGQHSVQASGVTSFLDDGVLPVAGLKVVAATAGESAGLAEALAATARRFEIDGHAPEVAYALAVTADPDYRLLRGIAEELVKVADPARPLYVVLDADVAHALGRILRVEVGWAGPLVAVDGVAVGELDYLDIGHPLGAVGAVPVTVKSLTFLTR